MTATVRTAVVVASAGRPDVVGDVLADIARQSAPPTRVLLSVPDDASLPAGGVPAGVEVVRARGAAAQRNAALSAAPEADIAFFFDDDARVREDYLAEALDVFAADPSVIALSGRVLLDGSSSEAAGAVDARTAEEALARSRTAPPPPGGTTSRSTLYGCNFAYRVGATAERFDERLPLYSWLEDHDLARRLLRQGRLVTAPRCVVVHRGVRSGGRAQHARFGYSQVMNPAHFLRKGSFPVGLAASEVGRRVAKNLVGSLAGPERSWRRERLRGNLLAAAHLLRGRITPEHILQM